MQNLMIKNGGRLRIEIFVSTALILFMVSSRGVSQPASPLPARASTQSKSNLDPASQEALTKTLDLLRDPNLRGKALNENAKTRAAGDAVKNVGGAENEAQIYELAAKIFERLTEESGGDSNKMAELLENAQRNPAAFGATLSGAEITELKALGNKIESKSVPKRP